MKLEFRLKDSLNAVIKIRNMKKISDKSSETQKKNHNRT